MNIEKKMIRTDIPGHHLLLNGGQKRNDETASQLVVGRAIVLRGEISACDHLIVEGAVEVQGLSTQKLDIADTGAFYGTAVAQDVVIAGRFEGQLTVHGRLTVKSTGVIVGHVAYGTVNMEAGATIEAHISALPPVENVNAPHAENTDQGIWAHNDDTPVEEDDSGEETATDRTGLFRQVVGY